ncbi:B12-binding domain-containing radical SAM protein [Vibrio campbellii]|uniref:B12-binding domain-containing radical SAM protein n=1 Tax=Vibrio campbellii TaxID=680 RepID=UPI000345AA73|nr:B12-binding domain-containing radical SAM protein [Vibrio campbellii]ARV71346.1 hypothetical protein A8140_00900 [Vibrio campbellii CAIM 519 = NBRC 15631 = ATCC 25920]
MATLNKIENIGGAAGKAQIIKVVSVKHNLLNYRDRKKEINSFLTKIDYIKEPDELSDNIILHQCEPEKIKELINNNLPKDYKTIVSGSVDERVIIIYSIDLSCHALSLGKPIRDVDIVSNNLVTVVNANQYYGEGYISPDLIRQTTESPIVLAGLYHPEIFPLPRVALGISCIARALRSNHLGDVSLLDMQLELSSHELVSSIVLKKPKVIAISVTFGQQDVLEYILSELVERNLDLTSRIIVGGSLAVLNKNILLDKYPNIYIGTSSGESTMVDFTRAAIDNTDCSDVPGVAYINDGKFYETKAINNRVSLDILPELDLLPKTLNLNGVMQLESSRGCSYACSFCPRQHKGIWAGDSVQSIKSLMPYIESEFNKNNLLPKKIFLVDEEFLGYNRESQKRIEDLADQIHRFGFKFETNSRVDQVVRLNKNVDWHQKRLNMWRKLRDTSLDRCLFGVESGVDSILERFNKKTTSLQNILAIRILSMMGIKTRYTYITYDHLMSMEELLATYYFLGRKDLIVSSDLSISPKDAYLLAQNNDYCSVHSTGRAFYEDVSYMLGSMENLQGANYTKEVISLGLATGFNEAMGRVDANYLDRRIGRFSYYSQLWIDMSYPFDYTLKSVQKISNSDEREAIHRTRKIIRRNSWELLGCFLYVVIGDKKILDNHRDIRFSDFIDEKRKEYSKDNTIENLNSVLYKIIDLKLKQQTEDIETSLTLLRGNISSKLMTIISDGYKHFLSRKDKGWKLKDA